MLERKVGTRYVLRLVVVSLHRDFNVRNCTIALKYREADAPLVGLLYWLPRDIYDFPEGKKALGYPLAQNLLAQTVLESGKPLDCYATFLVENPPAMTTQALQRPVDFEWVELRFTDFAGLAKVVTIHDRDIDPSRVLYDPSIFRDVTQEEIDFASQQ